MIHYSEGFREVQKRPIDSIFLIQQNFDRSLFEANLCCTSLIRECLVECNIIASRTKHFIVFQRNDAKLNSLEIENSLSDPS